MVFKPEGWLDRVFAVGIVGKGLDGAIELIGGLLLLLVSPGQLYSLAARLTRTELSEDPHDFIATHLLHTAQGLTGSGVTFGAIYLLAHGVVKVVLVIALLRDKLWAYPWMIAVLLAFIAYQLYRIGLSPTVGLVLLTVFDAVIVALTIREYAHRRRHRHGTPPERPSRDDSAAPAPQTSGSRR